MKNHLPLFSDSLLTKFAFFAFGLLIGGYYISAPVNRLLFSALFSLCASESIIRFSRRKGEKSVDKRFAPVKELLQLSDKRYLLSLLKTAFSSKTVIDKGDYLIVNGVAVTGKIGIAPLTPDETIDAFYAYKSNEIKKVVVLCSTFLPETEKIASKLSVKLVDYPSVFNLLKSKDCLPDLPKKERKSVLSRLRACLNRKRVGSLLACSALLFTFSQFVISSVYYIAVAVICLTLALVSLILPSKN